MTTRTHETIRVGLRRIIRDPNASVNERLQATRLLMQVEGLMEGARHHAPTKSKSLLDQMSEAKQKIFREILAKEQERKTG